MNEVLSNIDSLLKYITIIFLIYCCITFVYKFIAKKEYSISDYRISLITLIFVFFKFSASLLWLYTKMEFNSKNLISFLIILSGFLLHNKITRPEKKFFRLFVFYLAGLIIILV